MQVITLNPKALDAHAMRLAGMVTDGQPISFDAIVGVRRGGSIVCDAFLRHFSRGSYGERFDVTLQRPSTKRKVGTLCKLLKHLPYPLLDAMRMAESILLNARRKRTDDGRTPEVVIPEGLASKLKESDKPNILLIDDAIDSGYTLSAIASSFRHMNPQARISIAVMTETTNDPSIRADYTLYRNRTLIRFPWANDYKNH